MKEFVIQASEVLGSNPQFRHSAALSGRIPVTVNHALATSGVKPFLSHGSATAEAVNPDFLQCWIRLISLSHARQSSASVGVRPIRLKDAAKAGEHLEVAHSRADEIAKSASRQAFASAGLIAPNPFVQASNS
jgi:hypothetical protein